MPLDGGYRPSINELANLVVAASSIIHDTARLNNRKHMHPHAARRAEAYACINEAMAAAKGRELELAARLQALGYSQPVGRACKLLSLREVYP